MKSRAHLLAAAVALVTITACAVATARPSARVGFARRLALPQRLEVRTAGKVVGVDLESYVADTILSEVSPIDESAEVVAKIFETQAVIARTYAVSKMGRHRQQGFDLCDTTHCQLYQPSRRKSSRFAEAAVRAALNTESIVVTYDSQPIEALFHADCGGETASAASVWGGAALPYLLPTSDDLPDPTHRPWRISLTREQLRLALNSDARTAVGSKLEEVSVAARDESGRAASLTIKGTRAGTVRGDVLRTVLNRTTAGRGLLSTKFTIQVQGSNYVFAGTGFGHGVGLCQRGAATRLRAGDTVEDVLNTYYRGITLLRGR